MTATTTPGNARPAIPPEPQPVLVASGIEKSYHRGVWPFRHIVRILQGADLNLRAGEIVGLVGRTAPAKAR